MCIIALNLIVAIPAIDVIVPAAAANYVITGAPEQDVVSGTTEDVIVSIAAIDEVIAVVKHDIVPLVHYRKNIVVACTTEQGIGTGFPEDEIVAVATIHIVVAEARADPIVTAAAINRIAVIGGRAPIWPVIAVECRNEIRIPPNQVRTTSTYQYVAPFSSGESVVAIRADDDVIAGFAHHQGAPAIESCIICPRQCICDIALCRREYPVVADTARHTVETSGSQRIDLPLDNIVTSFTIDIIGAGSSLKMIRTIAPMDPVIAAKSRDEIVTVGTE